MASRRGIDGQTVTVDGVTYRSIAFDEQFLSGTDSLSTAERDIVDKVARGWSNDAIAQSRGTRPRTVSNQLSRLFRRFGVQNRFELIAAVLDRSAPR